MNTTALETETGPMHKTASGRPHVLLADDEQWYVQPLCDALEFAGFNVDKSRTGSETLALVQHPDKRPQFLVLDIMMDPRNLEGEHEEGTRTGVVVLEKIRNELKLDPLVLPVICLTVLEDEVVNKKLRGLGADIFCKKNAKLPEIVALIRSKLKH